MVAESNIPELPFNIDYADDLTVLEYYLSQVEVCTKARYTVQYLEYYILKRMESRDASIARVGGIEAKIKYKPTQYNTSILYRLKEVLESSVVSDVYTPEHQETITVPEKWDGRKIRGLLKYGKAVQEIIDLATFPKQPSGIEVQRIDG